MVEHQIQSQPKQVVTICISCSNNCFSELTACEVVLIGPSLLRLIIFVIMEEPHVSLQVNRRRSFYRVNTCVGPVSGRSSTPEIGKITLEINTCWNPEEWGRSLAWVWELPPQSLLGPSSDLPRNPKQTLCVTESEASFSGSLWMWKPHKLTTSSKRLSLLLTENWSPYTRRTEGTVA